MTWQTLELAVNFSFLMAQNVVIMFRSISDIYKEICFFKLLGVLSSAVHMIQKTQDRYYFSNQFYFIL